MKYLWLTHSMNPKWHRWVQGLCSILDGLILILSLGFVGGCFTERWVDSMLDHRLQRSPRP